MTSVAQPEEANKAEVESFKKLTQTCKLLNFLNMF